MLRNYLGQSVVVLFTLAAFFFVLIFVIGVADNTKTNNEIMNSVPLQQAEIARWGMIPGDLKYNYIRTTTIYSQQAFKPDHINLYREGPYQLQVKRDFEDAAWAATKSCINYNMNYTYTGMDKTQNESVQLMPNLEGLSIWYQKTHKPLWWKAWQALTQVSDLMYTSNMLSRYYAYNAFEYLFDTPALVYQGVLAGLSAADQQTVYYDSKFGMDSVEKLTFWVYANEDGEGSDAWNLIVNYYATKGINLDTAMSQICGPKSIIQFVTQEQQQVLLNYRPFDQYVSLDELYMTQLQWGQNSLLGNDELMMKEVPVLESMGQPIFDNVFVAYPEFGTFLQQKGMGDLVLSNEQVQLMLEQSTDSYQTLLNPDNMRAFYKQWGEGAYSNLYTRFGFTSAAQCDAFIEYLNMLVTDSLQQGNPLENSAFGELVERTLNQTYAALEKTMALETVVRNMCQQINASTGQLSCAKWLQISNPDNYTEICSGYNFSDVEQIKTFVNATWYRNNTNVGTKYGGYYTDQLMNLTGMTISQVAILFDTNDANSFGTFIAQQAGLVAVHYACASTANCTATEIAQMQWGASGITNNPLHGDPNYTPKQMTTMNWGAWPVYGCEVAVEYSYWMGEGNATLTPISVKRIQSDIVDYYGLLNLYNSQRYMNAYFTDNTAVLDRFQEILEVEADFSENLIYMVQGWLMEGPFVNYTSEQLIFGWDSKIIAKANGGNYWQGADFNLETYMTPIINDVNGPMAKTPFGLYAGSFTTDNVSAYRLNNGEAYLNKVTPIWNGTYYTQTPQQPNGALTNADSEWFDNASNGMQFPPNMNHDSVKVYSDRLIHTETYNYEKTIQVPTSVLEIQQYQGEWVGGLDSGFPYNLPYMEHSLGCGDCTNTTKEQSGAFVIKVQGVNYEHLPANATFDLGVQPDTGFTYFKNKESTMVLLLEYYTNSSQANQPAQYQPFPLPDLDPLVGVQLPIFDMHEYMNADQTAFLDKVGFVADNASKVRTITIWMIVLTCVFLIAAIVAAVMYRMGQSKESARDSEVSREEREQNEGLLDQ